MTLVCHGCVSRACRSNSTAETAVAHSLLDVRCARLSTPTLRHATLKCGGLMLMTQRLLLVLVLAALVVPAFAQEKPKESKDRLDWKPLFDGKSLKGWKESGYGGGAEPEVENGELRIAMGEGVNGVTLDAKEPPFKVNYEISLEAKKLMGNDFFCGLTFPVKESHASFIVGGWGGGIVGISSIDHRDASDNETTKARNFQKNTWYEIRLRVTDSKIQAWIDGEQMVDLDTTGKTIDTRIDIEKSKPLGLSTWQTGAAMRNIRIRALRPEELDKME